MSETAKAIVAKWEDDDCCLSPCEVEVTEVAREVLVGMIDAALDAAVAAERERCAKVAEGMSLLNLGPQYKLIGQEVAHAIRHQGGRNRYTKIGGPNMTTDKLYEKYTITRNEGMPDFKSDHFVLKPKRDPHARIALREYARSCEVDFPVLAKEINEWVDSIERGEK